MKDKVELDKISDERNIYVLLFNLRQVSPPFVSSTCFAVEEILII